MEPARFCPRCKRDLTYLPDEHLCPRCQEPLLIQGYCSICARPWKLAVGQMCPKHDLPLEEQPPESARGKVGEGISNWVTVETYGDDTTAEAHRLRLEMEGIPTLLDNERMGSRSNFTVATGGVELKVPEDSVADARVILDQNWTIPAEATQTEADDEWEGLAPADGPERPPPHHEGGHLAHARPADRGLRAWHHGIGRHVLPRPGWVVQPLNRVTPCLS